MQNRPLAAQCTFEKELDSAQRDCRRGAFRPESRSPSSSGVVARQSQEAANWMANCGAKCREHRAQRGLRRSDVSCSRAWKRSSSTGRHFRSCGGHTRASRRAGIDPKLVADQLGHGLGVNLDVYTIAGLEPEQRRAAVNILEQSLASTAINQGTSRATVMPVYTVLHFDRSPARRNWRSIMGQISYQLTKFNVNKESWD